LYEIWSDDYRNKRQYRIVIPVVFYHGKSAWNLPVHFLDNFDVNNNLKDYMLDFCYLLFDTNVWEPDLKNPETDNINLLCSMMLMKMAFHNDWDGVLSIFRLLDEKGLLADRNKLIFMFKYIGSTQEVDQKSFIDLLEEYDEGGDIMPVADLLKEEGRKEGMTVSKQDTLIKLMELRFNIKKTDKDFIKSVHDLDKLDKATEAILTEDKKENVLDLLK